MSCEFPHHCAESRIGGAYACSYHYRLALEERDKARALARDLLAYVREYRRSYVEDCRGPCFDDSGVGELIAQGEALK